MRPGFGPLDGKEPWADLSRVYEERSLVSLVARGGPLSRGGQRCLGRVGMGASGAWMEQLRKKGSLLNLAWDRVCTCVAMLAEAQGQVGPGGSA